MQLQKNKPRPTSEAARLPVCVKEGASKVLVLTLISGYESKISNFEAQDAQHTPDL